MDWYIANNPLMFTNPEDMKTETKLSKLAKRLFDDKTKKLIEAGFMDKHLNLTAEGREALNDIILDLHMEVLVKDAEEVIAEKKAQKI